MDVVASFGKGVSVYNFDVSWVIACKFVKAMCCVRSSSSYGHLQIVCVNFKE